MMMIMVKYAKNESSEEKTLSQMKFLLFSFFELLRRKHTRTITYSAYSILRSRAYIGVYSLSYLPHVNAITKIFFSLKFAKLLIFSLKYALVKFEQFF